MSEGQPTPSQPPPGDTPGQPNENRSLQPKPPIQSARPGQTPPNEPLVELIGEPKPIEPLVELIGNPQPIQPRSQEPLVELLPTPQSPHTQPQEEPLVTLLPTEPSTTRTVDTPLVELIEPSTPEEMRVDRMIANLREPGWSNYAQFASNLPNLPLTNPFMAELRTQVGNKVFGDLMMGQFGNLDGAKDLMRRLQMNVTLPEPVLDEIYTLYPRIYNNLLELAIMHKTEVATEREAKDYDMPEAKRILARAGFTQQELSDENVLKILNLTQFLVRVKGHYGRTLPPQEELLNSIFDDPRKGFE